MVKLELTGLSEGFVWGTGEVKDASKVWGLSNWQNAVSLIEKGKTAGGTGERVGNVLIEMPTHPPSEDFKVGSWLYRLGLRGTVWAGDTYLTVITVSVVSNALRLDEVF